MVNKGWSGVRAVTLRCRSWGCPLCQEDRRKQLVALALSGCPTTFITLTVNPAWGSSPEDRARRLVDAWRTIVRLVKVRYEYDDIPYCCVFEATKNGEPHLHILARVKWISQKWLSEKMEELMDAPRVDIRRVWSKAKLAFYVSKYLGKDPHRFSTCKRYWTTRNWELTKYEPPETPGRWDSAWQLVRRPLGDLVEEWRQQGYEVELSHCGAVAMSQAPPEDEIAAVEHVWYNQRRGRPW